jgi:N4-gp56 family major capsid protein
MSILRFRPEIWSAVLLRAKERKLVFAQPGVVNRDYEGDISQMGDVVHISSVGDPTIVNHTAGDTITYEDLQDAGQTMPIDQAQRYAFKVDDIDKRQARGDVMGEAMRRSAYLLAKTVDSYVAGLYTGVVAANAIGTTAITTGDLAYKGLVDLRTKLTEADVPDEGRYAIVPAWYYGLLLQNDKFVRADASGTTEGLRNGQVGRAAGFDVFESNACINVTGDDYIVQAGVNAAISYADQIVETEALRLQTTFADAVRGLHVWGAKLVRPDFIATLTASQTALA